MHNIVISGYYGYNNSGDEAILDMLVKSINALSLKYSKKINITVLSKSPDSTRKNHDVNAVFRFDPVKVIMAIKNCDLLISGGGSLLQDKTSTRSLIYYLSIMEIAKKMGKKVYIYANGIGPIIKKSNKKRIKKTLDKIDCITLRESKSAKVLIKDIGVSNDSIHITSDPVFAMESIGDKEALSILKDESISIDGDFICVSVRNWENKAKFTTYIAKVLDYVQDKYNLKTLFINMHFPKDKFTAKSVASKMKNKSYVLQGDYSPSQIMGVISLSKYTLSMRLHALIYSAKVGVPMIAFSYDPKIEYFVEEFKMPLCARTDDFDYEDTIKVIDYMQENYESYKEQIQDISRKQIKKSLINENILENFIKEL